MYFCKLWYIVIPHYTLQFLNLGFNLQSLSHLNDVLLYFLGSEGSVQSWASSLSFDSQSDEMTAEAVEFMRKFVGDLFRESSAIPLDQKSKFGQLAQVYYSYCGCYAFYPKMDFVSIVSETLLLSLMRGWCEECLRCVRCVLYLYTSLLMKYGVLSEHRPFR